MDVQGDPYRTLGVTPEASLNEIRSAYRRLVKLYHPDAAGERALSRFLAIQAGSGRPAGTRGDRGPRRGGPRGTRGGRRVARGRGPAADRRRAARGRGPRR